MNGFAPGSLCATILPKALTYNQAANDPFWYLEHLVVPELNTTNLQTGACTKQAARIFPKIPKHQFISKLFVMATVLAVSSALTGKTGSLKGILPIFPELRRQLILAWQREALTKGNTGLNLRTGKLKLQNDNYEVIYYICIRLTIHKYD